MGQKNRENVPSGKSRKGIVLFLCVYAVLVVLAVAALCRLMTPLRQWLAEYEAAQLENRCVQVFGELFDAPDWRSLYRLSGMEDTPYEGEDAYAAYMEARASGAELTYSEAATGLPGTHQYNVYLKDEKIAAFMLTGDEGSLTEFPQWAFDGVELFFERTVSVTVEKKPEYTVYINGVALDSGFTIRTTATAAEEYLPEGVHGYRLEQQYIDGLLVQPEVLVVNENGEPVDVEQDPQTGIYTLRISNTAEMTGAEKDLARNAAVADAKYAMRGITAAQLGEYFDTDSQVYKDIVNNPMFIQKHKGFSVDEDSIQVGEYCRYTDTLFSENVKLTVNVIRQDNTVKVYELDKTYFFSRKDSGDYFVTGYTNEHLQETVQQVRLTFAPSGEERISVMVDAAADRVQMPEMTVPESGELVGWAAKSETDGAITMTVRLLPDGTVLGKLEPMLLYPVYRSALDEAAGEA